MRTTLSSIPFGTTLRCATVELIDDISVPYRINAITPREDLASELLRTGECESVIKGSSSEAQKSANPRHPQVRPTQFPAAQKPEEEISMNTRRPRLAINTLCRTIFTLTLMVLFAIISASPAAAQIDLATADFVEWDLPSFDGAGNCPSSIGAVTRPPTGDPVYYVTNGACFSESPNNPGRMGPVMVKFTPGNPLTAQATWRAWNLGGLIETTGGMKITRDERYAFIRTSREIIRVNMWTNVLTHWVDVTNNADPLSWSDLALVERCSGYVDIYTAQNDAVNGGVIQRLTVQNGSNNATVKRWVVDGGAGAEFLSGVAYFSGNGRIYFSEGVDNKIGELDPNTNKVRTWNLSAVDPTVLAPRQISIDTKGLVWVVTSSGHLVSLDPCSNDMAAYLIPGAGAPASPGAMANPFGLGSSGGVVGFTESDGKKVGMLIPNKPTVPVTPSCVTPTYTPDSIVGSTECIYPDYGNVTPDSKPGLPAVHTDLDPLGEFIEVTTPDTGNFPIGIFRDVDRPVGNFWFVQLSSENLHDPSQPNNRISHVSFPTLSVTSAGLVTGGGTIRTITPPLGLDSGSDDDDWDSDSDGGVTSNFGFNVYRKTVTSPVRGKLNYHNKSTGEHVKSVTVDTFTISGNTATFSGTCTNNGLPCTYQVTVQDNGNPGKGRDTFNISGVGVTPNGGTLSGGNIKIHHQ